MSDDLNLKLDMMDEIQRLKQDSANMTKEILLERDRRAKVLVKIDKLKNERLKLHARLGYCYVQSTNALVKPIMTYEEWLAAIDKELSK